MSVFWALWTFAAGWSARAWLGAVVFTRVRPTATNWRTIFRQGQTPL
jgi:hypothetical protein